MGTYGNREHYIKSDKTKIFFKSGLVLGVEDILQPTNVYTVDNVQELFIYK